MEETLMTSLAALAAGASIYMGSPMADRDQGQPPQVQTAFADADWSQKTQEELARQWAEANATKASVDASSLIPEQFEVVIMGGAAAGLSLGACCKGQGINAVVLEKNGHCGDMWRSRYHRLHLHDIVEECDLPYMPTPKSFPVYPTRQQYAGYLDTYKDMVGLDVRNYTEVLSATRDLDNETGDVKSWLVMAQTLDRKTGTLSTRSFRCKHFCCAVGIYNQKKIPDFKGLNAFEGLVVHSSNYTNGSDLGLKGKKVLVVGFGNSGAEICVDLVEHGANPEALVRSPVCIVPRDSMQSLQSLLYTHGFLKNVPFLWILTPFAVLTIDAILKAQTYLAFGALGKLNLRDIPKGPILRKISEFQPPMMDIGTISCIKNNKLSVIKEEIREFKKKSVIFADGTERTFDACVMATGYEMATTHGKVVDKKTRDEVGTGIEAVLSFNIKNAAESKAKGLWFLFGTLQNIRDDAPGCAVAIKRRLDGKKHKAEIDIIDKASKQRTCIVVLRHIAFALCARAFLRAYPAYAPSRNKLFAFVTLWALCASAIGGIVIAGIAQKKLAAKKNKT